MVTASFCISLFEGTLHVDKMHVWFKITNITHALPVPVNSQTDFTPKRDFVPEWNSRPGTTTGVTSRPGDSRRHDILWWYHVNKYRVMRGNRIEWTRAGAKVAPVSCKHPLIVENSTSKAYFVTLAKIQERGPEESLELYSILWSDWPTSKQNVLRHGNRFAARVRRRYFSEGEKRRPETRLRFAGWGKVGRRNKH